MQYAKPNESGKTSIKRNRQNLIFSRTFGGVNVCFEMGKKCKLLTIEHRKNEQTNEKSRLD